jgi:hypothetical protein
MIIIRFPDDGHKRRALGWLAGRSSFKSWATGELMVPDDALPCLAREGICFRAEGPPKYEQAVPAVRDAPADPVQ